MAGKNSLNQKRRKLLKFLGLTSIFASLRSSAQIRVQPVSNTNTRAITAGTAENYITVKLLRPEDLLSLELRFYNFTLSGNTLLKKGDPAYMVVVFQPQSMMEQAWSETLGGLEMPTIPGRMIIGGDSRLVFRVPAGKSSIKLTTTELLAWENYDLVVNDRAKAPAARRVLSANLQNSNLGNLQRQV
ncbi:MAG: hypothetical protein ABL876_05385, partial [Chitinophagaceae bacterium]